MNEVMKKLKKVIGKVLYYLGIITAIDGLIEWTFAGNIIIGIAYNVIGTTLVIIGAYIELWK